MTTCSHLDTVQITELPEQVDGCPSASPRATAGSTSGSASRAVMWAAATRRPTGCSAHHAETGHPIIRSIQPGEDWSWCFEDELGMIIPGIEGETRIPPSPLAGD